MISPLKNILTFIVTCSIMTVAFASGLQQLKCYHVPQEARVYLIGQLDLNKRLHLAISLPIRNKGQQDQFLGSLYDPKSPDYRHYLTPQEYTRRFGPTQADYDTVVAFFRAQGFKVTRSSNRTLLDVDGTVKMIEATFHITLQLYKHPHEKRNFYAPNQNPSVALDIPLSNISGLDNFMKFHPVWGDHPHFKPLFP
jgi:subtilase family serine protease